MGYIEEVNEALAAFPPFWQRVGEYRFTENALDTLQINIGLKCNLACKHCHVESSPARTEEMSRETLEQCLPTIFLSRFDCFNRTIQNAMQLLAGQVCRHVPWGVFGPRKRD